MLMLFILFFSAIIDTLRGQLYCIVTKSEQFVLLSFHHAKNKEVISQRFHVEYLKIKIFFKSKSELHGDFKGAIRLVSK